MFIFVEFNIPLQNNFFLKAFYLFLPEASKMNIKFYK